MFFTPKRHEHNRLADAVLKSTGQGLFLLDATDKILPPVSQSLAALFRRQDFTTVTFENLLAPVVTAKTLTMVRKHIAALTAAPLNAAPRDAVPRNALQRDAAPRNADVVTVTEATVGILDAKSFRHLLAELPNMTGPLLAGLARRVRDGDRKPVE